MYVTTLLSDQLERYLDLTGLEMKLTAQNAANVDTPGYRAVGLDFAAEMEASMGEITERRKDEAAGRPVGARRAASVERVDGLLERPDGNNVSMDREGLKMAEDQLRFRMGVALLKNEYSTVMDAIHADSK
ncbi:flagellar basal body rod protein FlgB [Silvibacterium dinghuense]|uniref:Flagellar basal body rod protein FlgB n=2 Tax=Silvibacterium dinghuense TaxID=1560006 RepID=A0A4Q1SER3_9BACT|nr:flagellar basal body rod protein FlgB [Silvibacterium dinghuense]